MPVWATKRRLLRFLVLVGQLVALLNELLVQNIGQQVKELAIIRGSERERLAVLLGVAAKQERGVILIDLDFVFGGWIRNSLCPNYIRLFDFVKGFLKSFSKIFVRGFQITFTELGQAFS